MLREILGRRRRERTALMSAVLTCARWRWPVVPGVGYDRWSGVCRCGATDCRVPGAHPGEPPLLAATCDERMARWWWEQTPDASVILATGGRVAALSVPSEAGARSLDQLARLGVRTGPVVAAPGRYAFLVEPYELGELGELLDRYGLDRYGTVPSTLRFHGGGGYLALPPSRVQGGVLRWARPPAPSGDPTAGGPWLPAVADLVRTLVDTCQHAEPRA